MRFRGNGEIPGAGKPCHKRHAISVQRDTCDGIETISAQQGGKNQRIARSIDLGHEAVRRPAQRASKCMNVSFTDIKPIGTLSVQRRVDESRSDGSVFKA